MCNKNSAENYITKDFRQFVNNEIYCYKDKFGFKPSTILISQYLFECVRNIDNIDIYDAYNNRFLGMNVVVDYAFCNLLDFRLCGKIEEGDYDA